MNPEGLEILMNGRRLLRFDRSRTLPGLQRRLLDQMDRHMDEGVQLGGEDVPLPDRIQRAHFVVGELLEAIGREDKVAIMHCCTYLAQRVPELALIRIEEQGDEFEVDLVYGQDDE
jgi:hypothetical protein